MKTQRFLVFFTCCIFSLSLPAQDIQSLYAEQNFSELIKLEDRADEFTPEELYCIGYAFFQLENDKKAILMYDKAIEKGLNEDYIFLYKGLALRYDKQFPEAIKTFHQAIKLNPNGQKNVTELANAFYLSSAYDSALYYFKLARELPYELTDPYMKVGEVYQVLEDYPQALEEYKKSLSMIDKSETGYLDILLSIAQIEAAFLDNYAGAKEALKEVLALRPESYEIYGDLMEAHYALEEQEEGDSLYQILVQKYAAKELPRNMMDMGSIQVGKFTWEGQFVVIWKSLIPPKETLDMLFRIYLLSPDRQTIERRLMTEQTIQLGEGSAKHLLCERHKDGGHSTYNYGWVDENISLQSLENAVRAVLDKEIRPAASSNFSKGGVEVKHPQKFKKKSKEKKKRKAKKKVKQKGEGKDPKQ